MGGVGFAVVACVFFSQSSAVVLHFSGGCPSQSVVGSALVEVFRFLLRKGAVRPVSSSPGFFAAVWSSPRHQIGGVRFFFFLLEPFVGSVVLSVGVAQAFFLHFVFRSICLSP